MFSSKGPLGGEECGSIYKTKDYDAFHLLDYNRDLDRKHVADLMESMKESDYSDAIPIVALSNGAIVDGQHRFEARTRLDLPIYYTIIPEGRFDSDHLSTIQASRTWTGRDFIQFYAGMGKESYRRWLNISGRFEWCSDSHMMKILSAYLRNRKKEKFRENVLSGDFSFAEGEEEETVRLLGTFDGIQEVAQCSNTYLMSGWLNFLKIVDEIDAVTYDHDRMRQQIEKYEPRLSVIEDAGKIAQYKRAIGKLYDFNKNGKNRVSSHFMVSSWDGV